MRDLVGALALGVAGGVVGGQVVAGLPPTPEVLLAPVGLGGVRAASVIVRGA